MNNQRVMTALTVINLGMVIFLSLHFIGPVEAVILQPCFAPAVWKSSTLKEEFDRPSRSCRRARRAGPTAPSPKTERYIRKPSSSG
jgi:hypothetical protein